MICSFSLVEYGCYTCIINKFSIFDHCILKYNVSSRIVFCIRVARKGQFSSNPNHPRHFVGYFLVFLHRLNLINNILFEPSFYV
uniref:Uncharacterized protein n=1 Tax=Rhizophora mucronata TaxID=61149 RepID=A0A2P2QXN7_RHIMU